MRVSKEHVPLRIGAIGAAVVCGLWCAIATAQISTPTPFTQEQADSGRENYMISCASCHGDNLSGKVAPGLVGTTFEASWARHTTKELYEFIQGTMPACNAGALSNRAYIEVVAFILQENGGRPGSDNLTPETDVRISDVVNFNSTPPSRSPAATAH